MRASRLLPDDASERELNADAEANAVRLDALVRSPGVERRPGLVDVRQTEFVFAFNEHGVLASRDFHACPAAHTERGLLEIVLDVVVGDAGAVFLRADQEPD